MSPSGGAEQAEPTQRITHQQAALLLGCHVSNIGKLVGKGVLHSTGMRGPGVGTLDLLEVVQLREERAHLAEAHRLTRLAADEARRRHVPPDDDHEWLTPTQVAERLGVTSKAVTSRVRHGTIPHARVGKRIWVRADHLEVWMSARHAGQVRKTVARRGPGAETSDK